MEDLPEYRYNKATALILVKGLLMKGRAIANTNFLNR